MMTILLEILAGPHRGWQTEISANQTIAVGRGSQANIVLSKDTHLSRQHFVISSSKQIGYLRDLKSTNGTFFKNKKIELIKLQNGDQFSAGNSVFKVHIQDAVTTSPVDYTGLLHWFRQQPESLFALLDAARDEQLLELLQSVEREWYQSLYDGRRALRLAKVAPYLVTLPKESAWLETLVKMGWGQSWGIYLTSQQSLAEIRNHLRQFLLVKNESGKELYFRFYDPRVLRTFLPTCIPAQVHEFFGPIGRFLMEAEDKYQLLEFTATPQGVRKRTVPWRMPGNETMLVADEEETQFGGSGEMWVK